MKNLWFKNEFVLPILDGRKRDTIRKPSARLPKRGDVVAFSVGPRRPFAIAKVVEVESIEVGELTLDRRAAVARCYPDASALVRIEFDIIQRA